MFATVIGSEIADKLYTHYLKQSWLFHVSESSAQLTKKIATEAVRVTSGILLPLMLMNARIVLSLLMSLSIFIYDPKVAIIGLILFSTAYYIIFDVVESRLEKNGATISEVVEKRFRLMNEGFGGIKDILLLGRDKYFIKKFKKTGQQYAYSQGTNATLTSVPRYFMELVAFGSMIGLLLYLIASHDGNLGIILPILSVYALATFKLLPAFQQIYASAAFIKSNIAAFQSIQQDLINSMQMKILKNEPKRSYLRPKQKISLENITFTYPNTDRPILNRLNMSIPVNSVIGIVGPSGSGKSTVINILLGLLKLQHGQLKIDDINIDNQNRRSWQNTIGFVAQNIFLSEGTISENVAFGIPKNEIQTQKVEQALKLAHLAELTHNLKQGINTKIGERGVKLSGGQCQRIGIARALYHEAEVLMFDEATSSLDGITEKMIMDAIHDFSGQKTIIMIAHRLKTVQKCDQIFFIDKGKVSDQGTYNELIERNNDFKNMAKHS
jgi:HlyD family secretion protein